MTKATENGNGSTEKELIWTRLLFSYTLKSRQVRPATSFPLLSFTVTGTMTSVVLMRILAPRSAALRVSGGALSKLSLPSGVGAWLLGGACCSSLPEVAGVELVSVPAPFPGVMGPLRSERGLMTWGAGASGTGAG